MTTDTTVAEVKTLKKVSFGKIATKKADSKTAYPTYPATDAEAAVIAERILERSEQYEALKGALMTDKAELKLRVAGFYFQSNHLKHEVPSSVSVQSPKGEVLVTFQNRYGSLESEDVLLPILGDKTAEYFRQGFELKIKGEKLPAGSEQLLLDELQELFAKYNATDALEVKEGIKPVAEFHAKRHLVFTPEVNMQIERVMPIVAMVKIHGRGGRK